MVDLIKGRPIAWRDIHIDFIELIEGALGILPVGDEQIPLRQSLILEAIKDLESQTEALEVEFSKQAQSVSRGSIDATLDALGFPSLYLLPAEMQIRIRFSLDRLGLNPEEIFPDQNRL